MMDYKTIKAMAQERGVKIDDLLALAPKNDPFYTGRPGEIVAAEWFVGLWTEFGYTTGVHLRRVHYQVVSKAILRPDGTVYENTDRDWKWLCDAGKWARYLGLVDYEAFVDRRNPEAIVNAHWKNKGNWDYKDPEPGYEVTQEDWDRDLPDLPELEELDNDLPDLPDFEVTGYATTSPWWESLNQQAYHVEVWAEKTTMNDILKPLCERYDVNLVTGAGELSITAADLFMGRARASKRPARILYVSDYDSAGLGMPISVARKVEFFQRKNGGGLDIRLQPVILTADQVSEYSLPRVPVKDTDSRKANWEAAHGEGQVELDALEALYPGKLQEIVEAAILDYYDPELNDKTRQARRKLIEALDDEKEAVMEGHQSELDDIESDYAGLVDEVDELRARFAELVKPFQEEIDAYQERLDNIEERWKELKDDVVYDLEKVEIDLDDYALPEPDLPEEEDGTLYVSERDYLEQLEYYQAYRNGEET